MSRFPRLLLIALVLLAALSARAATEERNYGGHYEIAAAKSDRTFSLDVKQTGSRATISFSAAMVDGSGAAPDAEGKGHIEDGILSFKFKDSFKNEGTATLELKKKGYSLSMTVTKVVDPGPFHFYGGMMLKQTPGK